MIHLDPISEARLGEVNPKLAELIRRMAEMVSLDRPPIKFRVTQGLRSWNQQQLLYAQGRTAPGKIVTNAQPGHSWHQFGLAVDVVPFDQTGQPDWNSSHRVWQRLVQAGTSLGLEAGAEWRTFPDWPHFQLTGSLPASPNDEARQTYLAAGMVEVWKEAGLA